MFIGEIIISVCLAILLMLLASPIDLLMPTNTSVMLIGALVLVFLIFSTIVWKEKAADERENLHRLQAGRISFLIGSSILVLGIIVQSLRHDIDIWLILGLLGMVITKILSRIYSQIKQ